MEHNAEDEGDEEQHQQRAAEGRVLPAAREHGAGSVEDLEAVLPEGGWASA
jgi:hypothetical protein